MTDYTPGPWIKQRNRHDEYCLEITDGLCTIANVDLWFGDGEQLKRESNANA